MMVLGIFDKLNENGVKKKNLCIWFSLKYISGALTVNSTFNI